MKYFITHWDIKIDDLTSIFMNDDTFLISTAFYFFTKKERLSFLLSIHYLSFPIKE